MCKLHLTEAYQQKSSGALGMALLGWVLGTGGQLLQEHLWAIPAYIGLMVVAVVMLAWLVRQRTMRGVIRLGSQAILWGVTCALLAWSTVGLRASHFATQALPHALEGRDVQVVGTIGAMPIQGDSGTRFRFDVESAQDNPNHPGAVPPSLYLGWYNGFMVSGEREIALQRQPEVLHAGEKWKMTVRLKAPHGNSNPHGFDYELWMWEQDFQATGYVRAGTSDAWPQLLERSWLHPVEQARQSVRDAVFDTVSDRKLAGVVAALLVGDQAAIERSDWDVFRATGVAHLMSISGLHITMFAWLAAAGVGWLWRRSVDLCLVVPASIAGLWGGLALATAYAVFSGWGVPSQRTIWMLATVAVLRWSGKAWPWPMVWLLACAVVVAVDPWALMQAGFWLSFVAVGVLFATDRRVKTAQPTVLYPQVQDEVGLSTENDLVVNAPVSMDTLAEVATNERTNLQLEESLDPVPSSRLNILSLFARWYKFALTHGRDMMREQWVVTLALTPLTLLLFNQVSLVGLLANMLAIPWVSFVITPLAMLGVVWSPLWTASAWAVQMLMQWLHALNDWPLATVSVAAPPLHLGIAAIVGGLLLAMRLPMGLRVLGGVLVLPVLLWQTPRPAPGQFELLAADIGQGNAVLIRTAQHSLVYDAGPRYSRESDAGNRTLVPLLRALGEHVDTLILSHRDSDHVGGAPAILAMQPEAQLISSIEQDNSLQALRPATRCNAGQHWEWDGVTFEMLHPLPQDYDSARKSNALSCVVRIATPTQSTLLVGDIEQPQEAALIERQALRPTDVLLVPHHGSKTSSSAVFLDTLKPQIALVQAGYRSRFGHPAAEVMARYAQRHIKVFDTAHCGAAMWTSLSPQTVQCQRELGRRYWQHQVPP